MFLSEDKAKISLTIIDERRIKYNRIADRLGLDLDNYGLTEIFDKVFDFVEAKIKPKESLPEDLAKIKDLQSHLAELQSTIASQQTEIVELKQKIDSDSAKLAENKSAEKEQYEMRLTADAEKIEKLKSENNDLRTTLTEYSAIIEEKEIEFTSKLNSAKLPENTIVIHASDIQLKYLNELVKLPRVRDYFKEQNKNGKLNQIIPIVNAAEADSIGKMIIGWFFVSAKLGKNPLTDFDSWIQKIMKNAKS